MNTRSCFTAILTVAFVCLAATPTYAQQDIRAGADTLALYTVFLKNGESHPDVEIIKRSEVSVTARTAEGHILFFRLRDVAAIEDNDQTFEPVPAQPVEGNGASQQEQLAVSELPSPARPDYVKYSVLRQWHPNKNPDAFGADILVEQWPPEKELVRLIQHMSQRHDLALINVHTSRAAYAREQRGIYRPEDDETFILWYGKNKTGRSYTTLPSGCNEIRWMQRVGRYAHNYGKITVLEGAEPAYGGPNAPTLVDVFPEVLAALDAKPTQQRAVQSSGARVTNRQLKYTVVDRKMLNDARVISVTTKQLDRAKDIAKELVDQNRAYYMVRVFFYKSGETPGQDMPSIRYEWTRSQGLVRNYDMRTPAPRRERDPTLPKYEVLFRVKQMHNGRVYGDVLVSSLSRAAPARAREQVARAILSQESLDDIALYSTRDAYEANVSAPYLESHPDALRKGFLGSLKDGTFLAGEILFP